LKTVSFKEKAQHYPLRYLARWFLQTEMIFGNFNDLVIGEWGGLDVLFDPYTGSSTGSMRVTAFMDLDVAVRHAESFAAIQDLITS
jgi:hypothetical protein